MLLNTGSLDPGIFSCGISIIFVDSSVECFKYEDTQANSCLLHRNGRTAPVVAHVIIVRWKAGAVTQIQAGLPDCRWIWGSQPDLTA